MKPNFYKSLALSALLTCSLTSVAEAARNYELRAFYGDKQGDTVVVIDVKRMSLIEKVGLDTGSKPYPVDRAGYLDKVYAITRNIPSMDVIDAETLQKLGKINLNHTPRSGEAFNSRLGLALVAGADLPISSLIDVNNDSVAAFTIEDDTTLPDPAYNDHGGGNASGHPAWLSKNRFVVIDRARRLIQLWGVEKIQESDSLDYTWELTKLDTVKTPVSVHHILKRNTSMLPKYEKRDFYALAEGRKPKDAVIDEDGNETEPAVEAVPAAILKLRLTASDRLHYERQVDLPIDPNLGSHHADFHPDGQHIYVGSAEGHLYVIDRLLLDQETPDLNSIMTIETGAGTGHTRFIPARNMAIVTNHNDTFVTVINTETHTKIKDIEVSGPQQNEGEILQSHTNFVSPDSKFYYAFASDNGTFFEINLQNLRVMRRLHTGGVPVQGSFINWDNFSYSAASSSSGM